MAEARTGEGKEAKKNSRELGDMCKFDFVLSMLSYDRV